MPSPTELRQFAERLTFSYPLQNEQLGLGHAVLCAKDAVGRQPFAVFLPDDLIVDEQPALAQMLGAWHEHPGNYLAVEEVPPRPHLRLRRGRPCARRTPERAHL